MRLINTSTLAFQDTFSESPRYAILSHRWFSGPGGEATLQGFGEFRKGLPKVPSDLQSLTEGSLSSSVDTSPASNGDPAISNGIRKALEFCHIAKERGLEWAWLDTVSIDKTSSVELSEAINSMYSWYQEADICIVYLPDVEAETYTDSFAQSEWFTRGWTFLYFLHSPTRNTALTYSQEQVGHCKNCLRPRISSSMTQRGSNSERRRH